MHKSLLSLVAIALAACSSHRPTPKGAPPTASEPKRGNLSAIEAAARALALKNVAYNLEVSLSAKDPEFFGHLSSSFELAVIPTEGLFFDFRPGARIESYVVNGAPISAPSYAQGRLQIPAVHLRAGKNVVDVRYQQPYSNDGAGLYRFEDPEDHRVYLYTQFESFDANHLLPCFDQPDLRARLKLTVTAPSEWQVITATRESKIVLGNDSRRTWEFPATPPLSPYLFSLHAGPYHVWKSQAGKIPLRLFARESLKNFVRTEDWFKPTQQGLAFYGRYFGYPYPFKKYDQLIVPDFNAGAMENVAAVTFSERFIRRGPATRDERANLASVILHEMGHMWFGDLVTMKWWDGLWLNESFATYVSAVSSTRATEFKEAWTSFHEGSKGSAYWTDQLVTTHPIQAAILDTNSAMTNFDGITYGKGASVLQQLAFYLGEHDFREGLRIYFRKHAFGNTTLSDFIGALEAASHKDLHAWSKPWLEHAGLDRTAARFECEGGKISRFELLLTPPAADSVLRTHRTRVGLYQLKNGKISLASSIELEYHDTVTAVPALVGRACPYFVYPNEGDFDYTKVQLDRLSLANLSEGLAQIGDPFLRLLIWTDLFEMLRDGKLSPASYIALVEKNFPTEHDLKIIDVLLNSLHGYSGDGFASAPYYLAKGRSEAIGRLEKMLWQRVLSAKPESDEQKNVFDGFVRVTQTPGGAAQLASVLAQGNVAGTWELDQDRRWNVLSRLSALGHSDAAKFLATERARDTSERGIQQALGAESVGPDAALKTLWFDRLTQKNDFSFARTKAVLRHMLPAWQDDLRAGLADRFYSTLLTLLPTATHEFLGQYVNALVPSVCTPASVARLREFIAEHGAKLPPTALKPLRIAAQEDQRCVDLRYQVVRP